MNFKLKGNTLLNGDITSPEIPYAEFSKDLEQDVKKKLVVTLNKGHEILMLYKQMRNDMHISNVYKILEKIEKVYGEYDYEIYRISRII